MVLVRENIFNEQGYDDIIKDFTNFELSDFQKWAIKAIVDGDNALITAPTGSGKTLPAEFMIYHYCKSSKKRIIYTSPIKALSNQKLHDMRKRFPHISFGLLTGDCKDNPEADVLIMTTEILRNTLFNRKTRELSSTPGEVPLSFDIDIDNDLGGVIFDEVHYIADPERGTVWEQSLLMLPPHIPLLLLSATIHKPHEFASWIEHRHGDTPLLNTYLLPTNHRIVPLTHYMWIGLNNSSVSKIRDTNIKTLALNHCNKPILIKDSSNKYYEEHFYTSKKICNYLYNNYMTPKRQQVLNTLVKHLKDNNQLPALCFIFSRKQVEIAARDINISLHDDGGIIANTVGQECRKILMSKLPNYQEYLNLPEYKNILTLLEKGIAIHHAGLLTVLREMVEILFDKGYIKLLFATETFAVGINMPTKTVIFTSLEKFDGHHNRLLQPHEYNQMAGRAGRRGIDKTGTIFHCNSLFEQPLSNDYKHMLTGPSQTIQSHFNISYNFILNILLSTELKEDAIAGFVTNSLLNTNIQNEIRQLSAEGDECFNKMNEILLNLKTPKDTADSYIVLRDKLKISVNKAKKRIQKEMDKIESEYPFIIKEVPAFIQARDLQHEMNLSFINKNKATFYISKTITDMTSFLKIMGFLFENDENKLSVTSSGTIASQVQEVNSLGLTMIFSATEGFRELVPCEIAALIACLVPINIHDDNRSIRPTTSSELLNATTLELQCSLNNLQDNESRLFIGSNYDYNAYLDLQTAIIEWGWATSEDECKKVLHLVHEKGISTGDFIKVILKICNAVRELEIACEMLNIKSTLEKLATIPNILLKYVATNQSLYI